MTQVLEPVLVRHGQLERIHVVLEADDFHITHGALGGLGFVAENRRHGVGGSTKSEIPDDNRRGGLGRLACRQLEALGELGLVDVQRLGLVQAFIALQAY